MPSYRRRPHNASNNQAGRYIVFYRYDFGDFILTREQRQKRKDWETEHRRYDFIRIWGKRYAHMKARHDGVSTNHSHSNGNGLMSRDDFFDWCKDFDNLNVFLGLYFDWAAADFSLSLCPSIDRIDPTKGYVAGNIQWLSFADNCEKGHKFVDPRTKKMIREAVAV